MKKVWRMLLLAGVFTVLLCVSALAAGTASENLEAGFYMGKSEGMTITPVATGDTKTIEVGGTGYTYYQGSEKMEVSSGATAGNQYLVMLVTGTFEKVPTANNTIIYVNQKAATGSTVTFGKAGSDYVFPDLTGLGKDEDQLLTLLITSNDGTAMKKTTLYYSTGGDYDVKQYKLGDVNEDTKITATDALWVLQAAAGNRTLVGGAKSAADVNLDTKITATDALWILQTAAGNRVLG